MVTTSTAVYAGTRDEGALDLPCAAAEALRARLGDRKIDSLIVLGTGLASVAEIAEDPITIRYSEIPGFPEPECFGHIGEIVVGRIGKHNVAIMRGKVFSFEATGIHSMVVPIRAFYLLGVRTLFYSASVGSLRPEMDVGSLVLITDHLNLLGTSPLIGRNDERFGDRFPDLSEPYDPEYSERVRAVARKTGVKLGQGVYGCVRGPALETPAEIRMLDRLGADVVGMSLVPEVLLSRHCGIRVVGVANVTNLAVGISDIVVDHAQTLRGALEAKAGLSTLIEGFFED